MSLSHQRAIFSLSPEVHLDTVAGFVPGTDNQVAVIEPPTFGGNSGRVSYTHIDGEGSGNYYVVCAYNAAGIRSLDCPGLTPTAITVRGSSVNLLSRWPWAAAAVAGLALAVAATLVWRKRNQPQLL